MDTRGVISNRDRRKQIIDYSGLRYGNITPTDIDGFYDFNNRLFIFIELKHISAPVMPQGQRLAYERLCDGINRDIRAYVFIAEHNVDDWQEDIYAADAILVEYRYNRSPEKKWIVPQNIMTLKECIEKIRGQ